MQVRRARTAGVALAIVATVSIAPGDARAATEPPSPATGHAQVVATGVVTFGAGPVHWEVVPNPATTEPAPVATTGPMFIVSDGPAAVIVSDDDGPVARLAEGEALFRPDGASTMLHTTSPSGGDGAALVVVPGSGEGEFTPGAGARDVDLVRDELGTNEVLAVQSDLPIFLVVTAGSVTVGGTQVAAGATLTQAGGLTVINTGPEAATVVAAVVGPPLDGASPAPTSAAPAPTPATGSGGTSAPSPSPTSPASTSTTTTTTTTTEPPAPVDTDSDGLTDAEEAALGTDPNNQDSDMDGIPDGREVNSLGSNPLDTDTDSDGLTDALEVDKSCDINVPDTDGDGLGDAFEANSGFSECSLADTDGDGDDDLAEFSLGTDPRDPNCFSGPGSVCQN